MCVWLHIIVQPHYSFSQQSRSVVAKSRHKSSYCALTRTRIGCCTTTCRVNQNGPVLVQKDNYHHLSWVCFFGGGGLNRKTGWLPSYQFCLIIDSYISWWISMDCMPFTQDKQITDHTSSFKHLFSIVLAFSWCWLEPFICTSKQAFHLVAGNVLKQNKSQTAVSITLIETKQ